MSKGGGSSPQETILDKSLAQLGYNKNQDYISTYVPMEKYAIGKTVFQQPGLEQQALGTTNANYQQQFSASQPKIAANVGNQMGGGANLGMKLGKFALNKGQAVGQGLATTQLGSQQAYAGNLQNLLNVGQGVSASSGQALNTAATASNNQAIIDARAATAASNATSDLAGTAAGLGAGYMAYRSDQSNMGG